MRTATGFVRIVRLNRPTRRRTHINGYEGADGIQTLCRVFMPWSAGLATTFDVLERLNQRHVPACPRCLTALKKRETKKETNR